jgi:glycosyltransferase involved in cell wall biosynthesis
MAEKLHTFFKSDLFRRREQTRKRIIELAEQKYSWSAIAGQTYEVYTRILQHS